jgi:transcriptional regulator with XRE-family HTH domain
MTGKQLREWRLRLRLKITTAAGKLGVSTDTYSRMERKEVVPRSIALACAALSYGLPPIGADEASE